MYSSISQNFVKKLIENEFELSPEFYTASIQQNNVVILLKQESPILYVVSLVNGEKINLQNHEIFMNEYLQQLQNSFTLYHCSAIIALTVVVGELINTEKNNSDIRQIIDFVTKKELIPEENCFHAWWYVSQYKKTIEMEKTQPKNILHIKQIVLECLENAEQQQNYNTFGEIVIQAKQKSAFPLKSNNILLTFHLLCINALLFFCMLLFGARQNIILLFGVEHHAVFDMHQYYRIITYSLIHTNIIHLIQNSVYLYFFGMHTEQLYGKIQMATIYFLSAIGGGILSALCNDTISVGASGAIFGLIGAVFVYSYEHGKKNVGMNYMTLLLLVVIALLGGMLQQNTDYFGHFGGFIAGSIVSFIILRYRKRNN